MDPYQFFQCQGVVHSTHFAETFRNFYQAACVQETALRKLHLIADFDHTLTTASSQQCHDVVVLNKEYTKDVHDKFHEIMSRSYEDMRDGGNLAFWWKETNNLLVDHSGLTQEMFKRGMEASSSFINLREGVPALIACCRQGSIPFVITSAGITNVITETLHSHGVSTLHDDHFHIDSNVMEFHADGRLHRILPESPIHSHAKKYVHLRAAHIFRRRSFAGIAQTTIIEPGSSSSSSSSSITIAAEVVTSDEIVLESIEEPVSGIAAIILGDREGDFEVFSGVKDISVFRVGFANDEIRAKAMVAHCCDVVLVGKEQSMEPVLEMVRALIEQRDHTNASLSMERAKKWNTYYEASNKPPWEADVPFSGLVDYLTQKKSSNDMTKSSLKIIELGCGSSATAIWLAEQGHQVTAVDISLPGLERAQSRSNAHLVHWILADILSPSLFTMPHKMISSVTTPSSSSSSSSLTTSVEPNQLRLLRSTYDLVFDMQCFHVLRESSSKEEEQAVHIITDLLKPGGIVVVVVGALTKENENLTIPGPPKLTKEELLKPFLATGDLCLESCTLQRFCATDYYTATYPDSKPPEAWVAVLRKK